ncbi:MAG TPA: hypothetical protein H9903_16130 [Candidatus Aquabacterium excrementipullorum]|nr:hypothetical protein [Candidatus Aquabacterium excrementipullorum]
MRISVRTLHFEMESLARKADVFARKANLLAVGNLSLAGKLQRLANQAELLGCKL